MERFAPWLIDIWREVCRHDEIGETLDRVAPLLARRVPFSSVLLRRVDRTRGCIETLAASGAAGPLRSELPETQLDALLAWWRRSRSLHRGAAELSRALPGLLPPDAEGDALAGPLQAEDGNEGMPATLVLLSRTPRSFTREHEAGLRAVLEPLGIALDNDRRMRELVALRESAEADRRSLLSRLGRQDLQDTIVGSDSGLRSSMERVELAAPSDVSVLLLGETGSGKEVIARAIHSRSQRAAKPFLRVNCGAIPSGLVDSELFGHERGSFTGAEAQRKGWFERADGGTLFLDEIGELPLPAQVRLLRVLQDGSFERVGGHRSLHADVRIVAATHRDLQAMVAQGAFREDLWYRLAVFVIRVPPLRERPEDIPPLALHFALRAARRFGTPPLAPSPEDVNLLLAYPWPGNARELIAVMERAVLLGNGGRLEVAKALGTVPSESSSPSPSRPLPGSASLGSALPRGGSAGPATAPAALDHAVSAHIEAALARCQGRIEGPFGAAKLLEINPHTLRARMRKLGIDWARHRPRRG